LPGAGSSVGSTGKGSQAQGRHGSIGQWLDKLAAPTEEHFLREEEIIAWEGYPEAEHHQGLQEALFEEVREFPGAFEGHEEI
jgi:hemerythrin